MLVPIAMTSLPLSAENPLAPCLPASGVSAGAATNLGCARPYVRCHTHDLAGVGGR